MPTYNCSKYINQTLCSVFNQSFSDYEVIIVDDCSSDNTVEIIRKNEDKRISLIVNETNQGAAYCRNVGLSLAKGDYVAFLDGDDLWAPNKLERQLSFMMKNGFSFCYTNYEEIDENGNKSNILITGPKTINHNGFLKVNYVGCLTVMYERKIYPDLQVPSDIKKRNDYALWLKISEKADCHLLDETLAFYRRGRGISSGKKTRLFKYHMEVFQKLYGINSFKSFFFALRNVMYFCITKIKYKKRVGEKRK